MPQRDGFVKFLRRPGTDSNESIPPAYEAVRSGTTTLSLLSFYPLIDCSKILAQVTSAGGIDSLQSIPGLLKNFKIPSLCGMKTDNHN